MITCSNCGIDVTPQRLHYYIRNKVFCYDCFQKLKSHSPKAETPSLTKTVKTMLKEGKKPSEIAKSLGISAAEVYERANK